MLSESSPVGLAVPVPHGPREVTLSLTKTPSGPGTWGGHDSICSPGRNDRGRDRGTETSKGSVSRPSHLGRKTHPIPSRADPPSCRPPPTPSVGLRDPLWSRG